MHATPTLAIERLRALDPTVDIRLSQLRRAHAERFGAGPVDAIYSPGRAEVLGNHTDYNQGRTLSANVTASVLVVARPRPDATVRITSLNQGAETLCFDAGSVPALEQAREPGHWLGYVQGVFWAFLRAGHDVHGADLVVESTIPVGGGLSSSAAVETAIARMLRLYTGAELSPFEQAVLARTAENDFADAPCGYLDQATVGLSNGWLLMRYETEEGRPFTWRPFRVDLDPHGVRLVVGYDPRSRHALVDGKYALRQQGCFASVPLLSRALGRPLRALGQVSRAELEAALPRLHGTLAPEHLGFVTHVINENDRVGQAVTALEEGDMARLGNLMTASGRSALDLYRLDEDAPELRFVIDAVSRSGPGPQALGIRNMGGGFNATTLALVRTADLPAYMQELNEIYSREYGRPYFFLPWLPAPAADVLA